MIIQKEELLSAFVDEEVSKMEVRRLCKGLLSDERELARWTRYCLMRDVLRGNLPAMIDMNFATNVMVRIGMDPLNVEVRQRVLTDRWLKPTAGFGLAASVALAAVIGFQSLTNTSSTPPAVTQVAQIPVPAQQTFGKVSLNGARADQFSGNTLVQSPEIAARLHSYLVNHSEYAPSQGMMPYARVVVGYDYVGQ
jgi:sigma-E factor negative regulatory protein RseA